MTEQRRTALKELQQLDNRIEKADEEVRDFDPLLATVEEPAIVLESEVGTTRSRLQEMNLAERRLELSTEEKGVRIKRLEERMGSVRNLREEAAVSAELDMVKRALQSDEQEALTLLDQIRKLEERLTELEEAFGEAQELVEPKKQELLEQRSETEAHLTGLKKQRESFAEEMHPSELRIYEAIRTGGRTVAVAELTEDGACGNCYGVVPLQLQNEIRHGSGLIRCEGCGVILAAPEPPGTDAGEPSEAEAAAEESEDVADAEAEPGDAEADQPAAVPDAEAGTEQEGPEEREEG